MAINVVSRHLPKAAQYLRQPGGEQLFELIYKAEAIRLQADRINDLSRGKISAPRDFDGGIDVTGPELDRYWRLMAMSVDMESQLFHAKILFDFAWNLAARRLTQHARSYDTLQRAIGDERLSATIDGFLFTRALRGAWREWGGEINHLRNYFTHDFALGGMSAGWAQATVTGEFLTLLLPDAVREMKDQPKGKLSYDQLRRAHEVSKEIVLRADLLVQHLLDGWPGLPPLWDSKARS